MENIEERRGDLSRDELVQSLQDIRDIFSFESFPRCAIAPPVAVVLVTFANPSRRFVSSVGRAKRNRITGGRRARSVYDRFCHSLEVNADDLLQTDRSFRQIVSHRPGELSRGNLYVYFSKNIKIDTPIVAFA